jgi:hypothetical protein
LNPDVGRKRGQHASERKSVDALAAAVILLTGFMVRPDGWNAAVLGFAVGFVVPGLIRSWFLRDGEPGRRKRTLPPVAPWREQDRHAIGNRRPAGEGRASPPTFAITIHMSNSTPSSLRAKNVGWARFRLRLMG